MGLHYCTGTVRPQTIRYPEWSLVKAGPNGRSCYGRIAMQASKSSAWAVPRSCAAAVKQEADGERDWVWVDETVIQYAQGKG